MTLSVRYLIGANSLLQHPSGRSPRRIRDRGALLESPQKLATCRYPRGSGSQLAAACPADAAPMPLRDQQPARSRPRSKSSAASFDDLVGAGEDRWRNRQAQRLGGLEVDDQLELRRLLDR